MHFFDLYSWAGGAECVSDGYGDFARYYSDYFLETDVCLNIFIVMLIVSVAMCAIFYLWLGRTTIRFANVPSWIAAVVISGAATFGISAAMIYGNYDSDDSQNCTGIYQSSYQTLYHLNETYGDNIENIDNETAIAESFRQALDSGDESIPMGMAAINALYTVILTIALSFVFKRYSIHSIAIPA